MEPPARSGAEYFVEALEQYGVTRLFGNPGTTELPVVQSVGDSSIDYVLGLHEDIAVGMASGYARTRRYHAHDDSDVTPLGVVNLHVAPGLAHGVGNVIGASFAGSPLLVTAGNHSTDFQHEEPILGGELEPLVEQYTKWSAEVKDVRALPTMLRRAVRVALTPPTGPVFLGLPLDVMLAETDAEIERLGAIPNAGRGDPDAIEAAVELLVDAEEPVVVLGDEVARAGRSAVDAAVSLAEATGARIHGEFIAAEVNCPTDHPQWAGRLPGTEAGLSAALDTDTIVHVGVSTNTTSIRHEDALVPADARTIHVGPDAWELGKNEPSDVAVIGDTGLVAAELRDGVADRISDSERSDRLDRTAEAIDRLAAAPVAERPDDPRASKDQLGEALAEAAGDAYFVTEAVTSNRSLHEHVPLKPGATIANKSGGLGYGLPAAVGAAIAEREHDTPRDVVCLIGDGSYLYYPNTLYSAARYDVDLTVVVSDNRNYRILNNNTLRVLGGEEDDHEFVAMDFEPPVDIPKNAESHGADGRVVDDPDAIASAIEAARAESGPTVLDVLVHD